MYSPTHKTFFLHIITSFCMAVSLHKLTLKNRKYSISTHYRKCSTCYQTHKWLVDQTFYLTLPSLPGICTGLWQIPPLSTTKKNQGYILYIYIIAPTLTFQVIFYPSQHRRGGKDWWQVQFINTIFFSFLSPFFLHQPSPSPSPPQNM